MQFVTTVFLTKCMHHIFFMHDIGIYILYTWLKICLSKDKRLTLRWETSFFPPHCNPLQGKYRFFTGNSLCSISTLTCFGSVQGLKGANFIEIQGNICILYRNIALDSYIHVYVLITGISLLFEKQQHRILEKQGKPCK